MPQPLDFYFDFSSPYGYLAAEKINALAARHGRGVRWQAILLGAVFKLNGQQPLTEIPIKGDYSRHDMLRSARWMDVPFRMPSRFPISTVAAARLFYWLDGQDAALAQNFALAAYRAYFAEDRDISKTETVADIAATFNIDKAAALAAMNDNTVKERTRSAVDAAIALGVFGSPYIVVDGEPFWGADRLEQIDAWLSKGPW